MLGRFASENTYRRTQRCQQIYLGVGTRNARLGGSLLLFGVRRFASSRRVLGWCLFILLLIATAALTMSAETHLMSGIAAVTDAATVQPTYPSGCLHADPAYPLPDECRSMLTALPTRAASRP
jgi:hypothetical protein